MDQIAEDPTIEDLESNGWAIDENSKANWALGKLRYYKTRQAEVDELYDAEQKRLDDWRQEQTEQLSRPIQFFEVQLTQYHRALFLQDEKRKSVKLPNGVLKSYLAGGGVVIADADAFVETADDELVIISKKPNKTAIKEHIEQTGEVLEGVTVEPKERRFKVEVAG